MNAALLNSRYLREHRIQPNDSMTFQFDFPVKPGNYLAVCQGFMFGYGDNNDDHHVRKITLDIHSEIRGDDPSKVVVHLGCQMNDDSGHYMTDQGKEDSYVEVGVIAIPETEKHGSDDVSVTGITSFSVGFSDDDHHLKKLSVCCHEASTSKHPEGAYIEDNSNHKGTGTVYESTLSIPQSCFTYEKEAKMEPQHTFVVLQGFTIENKYGKDSHVRKLGFDNDSTDEKFVLRDKDNHDNRANQGAFVAKQEFAF